MKKAIQKLATWLQDLSDPNRMLMPIKPALGFFKGSVLHEQTDGSSRWFTVTDGLNSVALKYEIRHCTEVPGDWNFNVWRKKSFTENPAARGGFSPGAIDGNFDGYLAISKIQGSAQHVIDAYKDAKKFYESDFATGPSTWVSASKWISLAAISFLIFTYVVSHEAPTSQVASQVVQQQAPVQMSQQAVPQAQTAPQVQQPAAPVAVMPTAPAVPNEAHLSDDEKKVVASIKNSFTIGNGSKSFYIFSDPNCPHCRHLEASLSHLPDGYHAIMVPVAYQTGSKELAAKVMCSKDRASAWKEAAFSGTAAAPVCAKGLAMVDENNKLFEGLRLTSTPSFVSPGGVLFSGFMTPEQLTNLVKN